ncbi:MAG: hypothetical protein KF788_05075 [Piscinibacter sp.]|nr:hypothetical protein [Piscinibacter sp.]
MWLPQFRSAPTRIQFAKDGAWEQAWAFAGGGLPPRSDLRAYLAGRTEIAFEAFFGRSFFGVRFVGEPAEVEAFAARCLDTAEVRGPLEVFRRRLGLPLLDEMPAFAEVGCVNAWRSVGAIRIWERGQPAMDFGTMWSAALRSAAGRDTSHAKAIEFAYESPLPHWLGLPVSEPHERNHLSAALLRDALNLVTQAPDVPVVARCSSWGCTTAA